MAKRKLDFAISILSFVAPMLTGFAVSAGEPVVQPASLFREFSGSVESNGGLKATLRGQLPRACAEHFQIFSTGQVDDQGFVVFSIIDESAKGVRCIREGSWRNEDWVSFESLDPARYQVAVEISSSSVGASRLGAIRVGARGPMPPMPVASRVAMEASSCTQCNRPPQPGSGVAGGPGFRDDLKSVAERGRGRRPPGENDRFGGDIGDGDLGGEPGREFAGDRGSREKKRIGSSRRRSRADFDDDDDDDDLGVARAARGGGGGMNSMYGGGMMPSWYVPGYGAGYGASTMMGYGSQQMGTGGLFGGQATMGMSLFPSLATGGYGYGQGQNSMLPYGLWGR